MRTDLWARGLPIFYAPYLDQPNTRGLLSDEMHPTLLMRDGMMRADAAGLQIFTHAIGDEAISLVLDLYSDIARAHRQADCRFRIEHAQHMAAKDFESFRAVTSNCVSAAVSRDR